MNGSKLSLGLVHALLALGVALGGCGHRATVKECEEIVERVARLELERAKVGPATLENELKVAKESFKKDMGRRCVGRRVTEEAMRCVRSAKSSQEIEEVCFR
jgi:hypothetical protein